MGRNKIIGTDELIEWVNRFHMEYPDEKIQIPDLGKYIRQSRPNVRDTSIRRDADVRKYIKDLNEKSIPTAVQTVSNFKTLDIESFLEKNCSKSLLEKALRERDQYYSQLASSAAIIFERYEDQENEMHSLQEENNKLKKAYEDLKQQKAQRIGKEADKTIKSLRSVIKTYVNPEIANEILREEGLLQFAGDRVMKDAVDSTTVSAKTNIEKEAKEIYAKLMKGFD